MNVLAGTSWIMAQTSMRATINRPLQVCDDSDYTEGMNSKLLFQFIHLPVSFGRTLPTTSLSRRLRRNSKILRALQVCLHSCERAVSR